MNLLITGAWQQAPEQIPKLQTMGYEVAFLQWEKDPLPCLPEWVEGIIGNDFFHSHPIELFPNLRYIQLTSAGYDRVPMEYIKTHHIKICNARGVYSIPMAEFVLGEVLQHYKQLADFRYSQQHHIWEKHRGLLELYEKHVLIIGAGSIGTECARRFHAFGCHVAGIAGHACKADFFESISTPDKLQTLLPNQDIVVLTAPLNDATRGMLSADVLKRMKDDSLLVNISRGGLIDQTSLIAELQKGRISAILDVFEEEPLPENSPLWDFKNVTITPHNSFVGENNQARLNRAILENLKSLKAER